MACEAFEVAALSKVQQHAPSRLEASHGCPSTRTGLTQWSEPTLRLCCFAIWRQPGASLQREPCYDVGALRATATGLEGPKSALVLRYHECFSLIRQTPTNARNQHTMKGDG